MLDLDRQASTSRGRGEFFFWAWTFRPRFTGRPLLLNRPNFGGWRRQRIRRKERNRTRAGRSGDGDEEEAGRTKETDDSRPTLAGRPSSRRGHSRR
jgi:hypothetical protein